METVNLKEAMPTVEEALSEMLDAIYFYQKKQAVLKLIHGYGSTGVGGKIKQTILKKLESMKNHKQIIDYIPGDAFSKPLGKTELIYKYKKYMENDRDYGKSNEGITYVILRRI